MQRVIPLDTSSAKQNYEEMLTVKAAWYYYMENYTQQTISDLLGISRTKVVNLLEKARQSGVVQFSIRQDGCRRPVRAFRCTDFSRRQNTGGGR